MYSALFTLSAFATSILAAPAAQHTKRYQEGTSWIINNLDYFKSDGLNIGPSYITFSFNDTSSGIALNTTCTRTADNVVDYTNYYPCDGNTAYSVTADYGVSFRFNGSALALNRTYADSTLDIYPYEKMVSAYGDAYIQSASGVPGTDGENGYHEIVDSLVVPINRIMG
ncbi:hypothetical protein BDV97DRAFT_398977 [Delphinella strobiligena]|nr:hypothetical protein BDV97DRAFT_398977 [Delphinella strobiligena]